MIAGEKVFESFVFAIFRIAVPRAEGILGAQPRYAPGVGKGVSPLGNKHERILVKPRGVDPAQVLEVAKLIRPLHGIIPLPDSPRFGFEAATNGINVTRAGQRSLWG